jgi:hypothetical protein
MSLRLVILQNEEEIPLGRGKSQIQKHYLTQSRHTLNITDKLVRDVLLPMVRGKRRRKRILGVWNTHFSKLWNSSEGELEKVWDKLESELKKETVNLS